MARVPDGLPDPPMRCSGGTEAPVLPYGSTFTRLGWIMRVQDRICEAVPNPGSGYQCHVPFKL